MGPPTWREQLRDPSLISLLASARWSGEAATSYQSAGNDSIYTVFYYFPFLPDLFSFESKARLIFYGKYIHSFTNKTSNSGSLGRMRYRWGGKKIKYWVVSRYNSLYQSNY